MRLWSIQHQSAYEQLQETDVLHTNENFLFFADDFRFAYDWMADQLQQRVGNPPTGVHYRIWVWFQWKGQHKRPDM